MAKKLTPMMQQYFSIKERYKEELLFFRLGDFYELFFDDAITTSRELNITLTGRAAGGKEKAPMCGVPFHAADNYILKLINKGYKVAICEQVEDPADAKGIVKRDVVRVITPGTILDGADQNANNFLSVFLASDKGLVTIFADISTGELIWSIDDSNQAVSNSIDALAMYTPKEIIVVNDTTVPKDIENYVKNHMSKTIFSHYGEADSSNKESVDSLNTKCIARAKEQFSKWVNADDIVFVALGALLFYLEDVIKINADHLTNVHTFEKNARMIIDASCLRHLEISRNLRDGSTRGTLLSILDKTKTPMGARLLKQWVENPLTDGSMINSRQQAIQELVDQMLLRSEIKEYLDSIFDFERILTRVETGSVSPRDLVSLRESFRVLPYIKEVLAKADCSTLKNIEKSIKPHTDLLNLLERAIAESPAVTLKDGKVINSGYNQELDDLRSLATNSREWLKRLEDEIKEKTGIKLKTGYNKVFGYYFEVSHAHTANVPDYFVRKQTLTNAERYITPELKEFEIKILSAKDQIVKLEQELFAKVREELRQSIEPVQKTARALAELDVYCSLSEVAYEGRYICPKISNDGKIYIKDGRHPVIEKFLHQEVYVPNDILLDHDGEEFLLITGPNMAGKSTYMRQIAILMIMAQIGAFIPATEAVISPVDRIFTRVGASDDISTGQSTFMVEMKEVAYILENATKNSLIILDEIGRGTSTFDGLSIAKSVVEHIVEHIHAKTLFATHYHELINLEEQLPEVKNYTVAVKEKGKDVIFLRRIIRGGADRSYGIHVAKLAGLPKSVLTRADEILNTLESNAPIVKNEVQTVNVIEPKVEENNDMGLGNLFTNSVLDRLKNIDILSMTPIEALNELYSLQNEARKGDGK